MYDMYLHFFYTDSENVLHNRYKIVYFDTLKQAKDYFDRMCMIYSNVYAATVYKEGVGPREWTRKKKCQRNREMEP